MHPDGGIFDSRPNELNHPTESARTTPSNASQQLLQNTISLHTVAYVTKTVGSEDYTTELFGHLRTVVDLGRVSMELDNIVCTSAAHQRLSL